MNSLLGAINLNLPASPQLADTAENHQLFEELWRIYMALQAINTHYTGTLYGLTTLSPYSATSQVPVTCTEAIPQGKLVHLTSIGETLTASLADATDEDKWANAIALTPGVPGGIIYVAQRAKHLSGFSGLTVNATYFLSAAGGISLAPPSSGIVQPVGIATSATGLYYEYHPPVRL